MSNPKFIETINSVEPVDVKTLPQQEVDSYYIAEPDRGTLGDLASSFSRGVVSSLGMIGDTLTTIGINNPLKNYADELKQEYHFLKPDIKEAIGENNWLKEKSMEAMESIGIMTPALVGSVALGALGAPATIATIGSSVLGGGIFGGSRYQEALKEYDKKFKGTDAWNEEDRKAYAAAQGGKEWLTETLGEAILFKIPGLKSLVGKNSLTRTIKDLLKSDIKATGKHIGKTVLGELTEEEIQGLSDLGLQQKFGIEDHELGDYIDTAVDTITPTVMVSMLFGGGTAFLSNVQKSNIKKVLTNPDQYSPDVVENAIQTVYKGLQSVPIETEDGVLAVGTEGNKQLADTWLETAKSAIESGQPININEDIANIGSIKAAQDIDQVAEKTKETVTNTATRILQQTYPGVNNEITQSIFDTIGFKAQDYSPQKVEELYREKHGIINKVRFTNEDYNTPDLIEPLKEEFNRFAKIFGVDTEINPIVEASQELQDAIHKASVVAAESILRPSEQNILTDEDAKVAAINYVSKPIPPTAQIKHAIDNNDIDKANDLLEEYKQRLKGYHQQKQEAKVAYESSNITRRELIKRKNSYVALLQDLTNRYKETGTLSDQELNILKQTTNKLSQINNILRSPSGSALEVPGLSMDYSTMDERIKERYPALKQLEQLERVEFSEPDQKAARTKIRKMVAEGEYSPENAEQIMQQRIKKGRAVKIEKVPEAPVSEAAHLTTKQETKQPTKPYDLEKKISFSNEDKLVTHTERIVEDFNSKHRDLELEYGGVFKLANNKFAPVLSVVSKKDGVRINLTVTKPKELTASEIKKQVTERLNLHKQAISKVSKTEKPKATKVLDLTNKDAVDKYAQELINNYNKTHEDIELEYNGIWELPNNIFAPTLTITSAKGTEGQAIQTTLILDKSEDVTPSGLEKRINEKLDLYKSMASKVSKTEKPKAPKVIKTEEVVKTEKPKAPKVIKTEEVVKTEKPKAPKVIKIEEVVKTEKPKAKVEEQVAKLIRTKLKPSEFDKLSDKEKIKARKEFEKLLTDEVGSGYYDTDSYFNLIIDIDKKVPSVSKVKNYITNMKKEVEELKKQVDEVKKSVKEQETKKEEPKKTYVPVSREDTLKEYMQEEEIDDVFSELDTTMVENPDERLEPRVAKTPTPENLEATVEEVQGSEAVEDIETKSTKKKMKDSEDTKILKSFLDPAAWSVIKPWHKRKASATVKEIIKKKNNDEFIIDTKATVEKLRKQGLNDLEILKQIAIRESIARYLRAKNKIAEGSKVNDPDVSVDEANKNIEEAVNHETEIASAATNKPIVKDIDLQKNELETEKAELFAVSLAEAHITEGDKHEAFKQFYRIVQSLDDKTKKIFADKYNEITGYNFNPDEDVKFSKKESNYKKYTEEINDDPVLSLGRKFRASDRITLETVAQEFLGARVFKSGVIKVVQSIDDLPEKIRDSKGFNSTVAGVYYKGTIYVVADNVHESDVEGLLAHEIIHQLLRHDEKFKALRSKIIKDIKSNGIENWHKSVAKAIRNNPHIRSPKLLEEEAFAYYVQDYVKPKDSIFLKLKTAVKAFLARLGIEIRFTDEEILSLITGRFKNYIDKNKINASQPKFSGDTFTNLWYSRLNKIVESKKFPESFKSGQKAKQQFERMIKSGQIPKPVKEELEWSGLMDWLDTIDTKLTKEDILKYLKENEFVIKDMSPDSNKALSNKDIVNKYNEFFNKLIDYFSNTPDNDLLNIFIKKFNESDRKSKQIIDNLNNTLIKLKNINNPNTKIRVSELLDIINHYRKINEVSNKIKISYLFDDVLNLYNKGNLPKKFKDDFKEINDDIIAYINSDISEWSIVKLFNLTKTYYNSELMKYDEFKNLFNYIQNASDNYKKAREISQVIINNTYIKNNIIPTYPFNEYTIEGKDSKNYQIFKLIAPNVPGNFVEENHWPEPNIITFARTTDKIDSNGNKVLFVEEIQSDWNQQYRKGETDIKPSHRNDAWLDLIMKRLIRFASEHGYDSIAFTTGEQIRERYDLGQVIDQIQYKPLKNDAYEFKAIIPIVSNDLLTFEELLESDEISSNITIYDLSDTYRKTSNPTLEDISKVFSPDVAKMIKNGEGKSVNDYNIIDFPEGSTIGGEWALDFYNKKVPKKINKLIKPYKTKIEVIQINHGRKGIQPQLGFKISDELRDEAVRNGFPKFSKQDKYTYEKSHPYVAESYQLTNEQFDSVERFKETLTPEEPLYSHADMIQGTVDVLTNNLKGILTTKDLGKIALDKDFKFYDYLKLPNYLAEKYDSIKIAFNAFQNNISRANSLEQKYLSQFDYNKVITDLTEKEQDVFSELAVELDKQWESLQKYDAENGITYNEMGDKALSILKEIANKHGLDNYSNVKLAYTQWLEANHAAMSDFTEALAANYPKVKGEINKLIKEIGRIKYYYPRVRKGNTEIRITDKNGETVYYTQLDTHKVSNFINSPALVQKLEELKIEYPESEYNYSINKVKKLDAVYGLNSQQRLVIDNIIKNSIEDIKAIDDKTKQYLTDHVTEEFANFLKLQSGFTKGLKREKNYIPGYQTDNVIEQMLYSLKTTARTTSKLYLYRSLQRAYNSIESGNINERNALNKYIAGGLRGSNAIDRKIRKFSGLAFTAHIAGNISSALVNLTSLPINTYWYLTTLYGKIDKGSLSKTAKHLIKGMNYAAKLIWYSDELGLKKMKLSLFNENDLERISKETGVPINKLKLLNRFLNSSSGKAFLTEALFQQYNSKSEGLYQKTLQLLSVPFRLAEVFNRITTFMSAVEVCEDIDAISETDYYNIAESAVGKTQGIYSQHNLPMFLQGDSNLARIGKASYIFQHYTVTQLSLWEEMTKNLAREGRQADAMKFLGGSLGTLAMLGGISSLPFVSFFLESLFKLTGYDAEDELKKILGITGMKGLPTLFGIDLSGKMNIGLPFLNSFRKNADSFSAMVLYELFPIPAQLADTVSAATLSIMNKEYVEAAEKIVPYAGSALAANAVKAYRLYNEGVTTRSGKQYLENGKPYYFNMYESILKGAGFQPLRYSEFWDKQSIKWQKERFIKSKCEILYKHIRKGNWEWNDVIAYNSKLMDLDDPKLIKKYIVTPEKIINLNKNRFIKE